MARGVAGGPPKLANPFAAPRQMVLFLRGGFLECIADSGRARGQRLTLIEGLRASLPAVIDAH